MFTKKEKEDKFGRYTVIAVGFPTQRMGSRGSWNRSHSLSLSTAAQEAAQGSEAPLDF